MRFSPDGAHLLGGIGASGVYLDGVPIVANGNGGGWDWIYNVSVMGPGGYTAGAPGFYGYALPSGPLTQINWLTATSFFTNGAGSWLRYLADGKTGSTDSAGNAWPSRVAVGFQGDYELFTDQSGVPLIYRNITTDIETTLSLPDEWTLLPDGSWFSRNYRGTVTVGVLYACGYLAEFGGLCVWRPFVDAAPVWLLSGTGTDFNPDIKVRTSDGMLMVGSGLNQGETGQMLYTLDVINTRFQVNGGAWQPLTPAEPPQPQPDPIVAIGRPCWLGWFEFAEWSGREAAPHNCLLSVANPSDPYVRLSQPFQEPPIARYLAVANDSDIDALEAAIRGAKAAQPNVPVLAYWTYQAQQIRVPAGADYVGVEAYRHVTESVDDFEVRVSAAVRRCKAPWLIAQCYTSNTGNTSDLRSIPPVIARVAKAFSSVAGILSFSGSGRPTGYQDHPEVHQDWQTLAAGIPGAPPLPSPPQPQEPEPMLYSQTLLSGFLTGTLIPHPDGGQWVAIQKPNGNIVAVTPDGDIQERPAGSAGAWERFRKSSNFLVAERDGNRAYAFEFIA